MRALTCAIRSCQTEVAPPTPRQSLSALSAARAAAEWSPVRLSTSATSAYAAAPTCDRNRPGVALAAHLYRRGDDRGRGRSVISVLEAEEGAKYRLATSSLPIRDAC